MADFTEQKIIKFKFTEEECLALCEAHDILQKLYDNIPLYEWEANSLSVEGSFTNQNLKTLIKILNEIVPTTKPVEFIVE